MPGQDFGPAGTRRPWLVAVSAFWRRFVVAIWHIDLVGRVDASQTVVCSEGMSRLRECRFSTSVRSVSVGVRLAARKEIGAVFDSGLGALGNAAPLLFAVVTSGSGRANSTS